MIWLTPLSVDLQPKNIMLAIDDQSILVELDEREGSAPSPRKIDGDRVIHTSQQLIDPKKYGRPTLCDFGEARFGKLEHIDDIQPWFYRAPEVILDLPWNNKVDIWNLGVMVCSHFSLFWLLHFRHQGCSVGEGLPYLDGSRAYPVRLI